MNTQKTFFVQLVLAGAIFFLSNLGYAQIPQMINYQGMLTDPATGEGLTGNFTMTFSIYETATGGTALWSETQSVAVNNGLFHVLLGSINPIPLDLFNQSERYLGVKVGTDAEMTPRQKLVSVGYAFKANETDHLMGKDTADFVQSGQKDAISTAMIQNNAVTTDKVEPKIVSSINNVSNDGGNIDLVAGSNVTITPDDENNQITISSSGGGSGDNLGNHTATQNIKLNGHWLSGDGGNEGVYVTNTSGKVGIGTDQPNSNFAAIGNARIGAATNTATGNYAIAMGEGCSAGDVASIAIGKNCAASAAHAVALGKGATANNLNCVSAGYYCNAYGNPSVAIGSKIAVGGNFSVGIGLDDTQRQVTSPHVLAIMGGKVGIGTTNPGYTLDVNGTARVSGFRMQTGAGSGKVLTSDASGNASWQTPPAADNLGNHTATQNIKLNGHWLSGDGGNEGVYVTNTSGKVGIGTDQPNSNFAAIGNARIGSATNTATGNYAIAMGEGCSAGDVASIAIGKNCAASAAHAVALGKGATANNLNCVSAGYYCNAYGNPSVAIGSRIAVGGNFSVGIGLDDTQRQVTAPHVLAIMGGKVGIGTTNPGYTLDVNGTTRVSGFRMQTGAGSGKILTSDASGNASWQTPPPADNLGNHTATQNIKLNGHWLSGDGGNEGVYVKSDGKVGMGLSNPNYALHIWSARPNDQIRFESNTANGNPSIYIKAHIGHAQIFMDRANDLCESAVNFYDNGMKKWRVIMPDRTTGGAGDRLDVQNATGSSIMTFLQNGNVGIGTKNPTTILCVKQGSATDPVADAWNIYSSRRWKTNIHEIGDALDKVLKLRGVSFNWKNNHKRDIGLIAEEVGEIFPEIVTYEKDGINAKAVDYSRLVAVLIEAVKEQQQEIQKLKQKLGLTR